MAIATIGKLNFFVTIISLIIIILSFSNSYGEEDGKARWGFSLSAGTDQKSKNDLTMYDFLPRVDLPLHKNWDLEFEGNLSYYGIHDSKDLYLLGVNTNIIFKPIQSFGIGVKSLSLTINHIHDSFPHGTISPAKPSMSSKKKNSANSENITSACRPSSRGVDWNLLQDLYLGKA